MEHLRRRNLEADSMEQRMLIVVQERERSNICTLPRIDHSFRGPITVASVDCAMLTRQ
jgi:hypothetical protein